jgi:hypothetical protein
MGNNFQESDVNRVQLSIGSVISIESPDCRVEVPIIFVRRVYPHLSIASISSATLLVETTILWLIATTLERPR